MPSPRPSVEEQWYVYMIRCSDSTIYTGITNDLEKRIRSHNSARGGARYTRGRQPVTLIYCESRADRARASRREAELKKLARKDKEKLASRFAAEGKPRQGGLTDTKRDE